MMLQRALQAILDVMAAILNGLFGLLPKSPFQSNFTFDNQILAFINYFVPISGMLSILSAYLVSVAAYYAIRWAMRVLRAIQ